MKVLAPLRTSLFAVLAASLAFACGGKSVEDPATAGGDDTEQDAGAADDDDSDSDADDDNGADDDSDADDDNGGDDDNGEDDTAAPDTGGSADDGRPNTSEPGVGMGGSSDGAVSNSPSGAGGSSSASAPATSPGIPVEPGYYYDEEYEAPEPIELSVDVPEECDVGYLSGTTRYCEFDAQCNADYVYTYCYLQNTDSTGSETWSCDCQDGKGYRNMQFEDADPETLCPAVMELCAAGEAPQPVAPEAEPECSTNYRDSSSDWCNVELGCSQDATLGDSLEVSITERKAANCQRLDEDQWMCSCYDGSGQESFTLKNVENAPSLCVEIRELCNDEGVEPEGEIDCTPSSVNTGTSYCYGELTCEQPATLGGTDVLANGRANVQCEKNGDAWQCYCYGGEEQVEFRLSGDTAWDVCNDAMSECEAAVVEGGVLTQGGYGYYGIAEPGRPIPLAASAVSAGSAAPPAVEQVQDTVTSADDTPTDSAAGGATSE